MGTAMPRSKPPAQRRQRCCCGAESASPGARSRSSICGSNGAGSAPSRLRQVDDDETLSLWALARRRGSLRLRGRGDTDSRQHSLGQRVEVGGNGAFWEPIAARDLHWFHDGQRCWLHEDRSGLWSGWCAETARPVRFQFQTNWRPWRSLLDSSDAPMVRWFCGASTNAAFNELDRHVLRQRGSLLSLIAESDRRAADFVCLRELLADSVVAAHVMSTLLGVLPPQRATLLLANVPAAVTWIEACKRMALPYVAIAGATAAAVADRLVDSASSLLAVSDDRVATARAALAATPSHLQPKTLLVDVFGQSESPPSGWHLASDLLPQAEAALGRLCSNSVHAVVDEHLAARALWRMAAPRPVDASHPLFVLYTSGSTGRPRGIVHVHGGYEVGLVTTARLVFGRRRDDTLFVVATNGWITGQSYMIAAALLTCTPTVLLDGSPLSSADRVAQIVSHHYVTILKSGSTFLRMLMTCPGHGDLVSRHRLWSLRLCTFCAEPVAETVHRFAVQHFTPMVTVRLSRTSTHLSPSAPTDGSGVLPSPSHRTRIGQRSMAL